jgi:hypothetical protein
MAINVMGWSNISHLEYDRLLSNIYKEPKVNVYNINFNGAVWHQDCWVVKVLTLHTYDYIGKFKNRDAAEKAWVMHFRVKNPHCFVAGVSEPELFACPFYKMNNMQVLEAVSANELP